MNPSPRYKIKDPEKYIEYLNSLHMNALTLVPCYIIRGNFSQFKCILSLTPNAIVFLRYKTFNKPISIFRIVPILDILKITYQYSNETYTIITINDHYYQIQTPNFLFFFHKLDYFYRRLIFGLPNLRPIKVEKFKPIQTTEITSSPLNVTLLRYEAVSVQHSSEISIELGRHFLNFETSSRCYFNFESNAWPFTHPHILTIPLLGETQLSVLRFTNVAPNIICKAINGFLQHMKSLTTIIVEDYEDLQFEHFCFSNIVNPAVVSWSFINVFKYNSHRLPSFFEQFFNYRGTIQTFHVENFNFNGQASIQFSQTMIQGPAFRTLELLILRNISFDSPEETGLIYDNIISIPNYLPTLFGFEFTTSIKPIPIRTAERIFIFFTVESLSSFSLSHIDLSNVEVPFHLPSKLLSLELNHCSFSSKSLIKLMEAISSLKNNICLSLENIIMHVEDWNEFTTFCEEKGSPLTNISELNWSENILDIHFVPAFCKIFLPLETIRCFKYNRTISEYSIPSFLAILDHLKNGNLWGLELSGGSVDITRLGSSLITIIEKVVTLPTLEHLDISNHDLDSDSATIVIQTIVDNLKMLQEFSFDGTLIDDKEIFYFLYEYIFDSIPLRSVQRPTKDMDRLFGPLEEGQEQFHRFQKYFKSTKIPSTTFIRTAFYYQKLDIFADFNNYYSHFPCTLYPDLPNDKYWLSAIDPISSCVRSIYSDKFTRIPKEPFTFHQLDLIPSPFDDTEFDEFTNKTTFKTPALLETFKKYWTKDAEKQSSELSDYTAQQAKVRTIGTNDVLNKIQPFTVELATVLNDIEVIREVMTREADVFEQEEKRKSKYRKRHRKKTSSESIQSMTFLTSSVADILSTAASSSTIEEDALLDDDFRSIIKVQHPIEYISKDAIILLQNKCNDVFANKGEGEGPTTHAIYIERKSSTFNHSQDFFDQDDSDDLIHLEILDEEDYQRSRIKWHKRIHKRRKIKENEYDEYEEYEYPDIVKNKKMYSAQVMLKSIQSFSTKYKPNQLEILEDLREFGQEIFNAPLSKEAKAALPILPLPSDISTIKKTIMPLPRCLSQIAQNYIDIVSPKDNDLPEILDTKRYEMKVKKNEKEDTFNYFGNFIYAKDKVLNVYTKQKSKKGNESLNLNDETDLEPEEPQRKRQRKSSHKKKKKRHHKKQKANDYSESDFSADETSSKSQSEVSYDNNDSEKTPPVRQLKEKKFNQFGFTIISDSEYDDVDTDTTTIRINSDYENEYSYDESFEPPTLLRKVTHKATPLSYTINCKTTENALSPLGYLTNNNYRRRHRRAEISRSLTDDESSFKQLRENESIRKAFARYLIPLESRERRVTFLSNDETMKHADNDNGNNEINNDSEKEIFKTIMVINPTISKRLSKSHAFLPKFGHASSTPITMKTQMPSLMIDGKINYQRSFLPPPLNLEGYEESILKGSLSTTSVVRSKSTLYDKNDSHSASKEVITRTDSNDKTSNESNSDSDSSHEIIMKPKTDSDSSHSDNTDSDLNHKTESNRVNNTDSDSSHSKEENNKSDSDSNDETSKESNSDSSHNARHNDEINIKHMINSDSDTNHKSDSNRSSKTDSNSDSDSYHRSESDSSRKDKIKHKIKSDSDSNDKDSHKSQSTTINGSDSESQSKDTASHTSDSNSDVNQNRKSETETVQKSEGSTSSDNSNSSVHEKTKSSTPNYSETESESTSSKSNSSDSNSS